MADVETLGILEEIEVLVSDKLQVVSYKWLSRNYLVSSNVAKRLLQEFVEKHGSGLEVVYTVSGWLKRDPPVYHIRLVSGPKLSEAQQEFGSKISVQVYSVQACIPNDPAALWNAEFVQAEELFFQPPTVDNCLRDNRFCGIINAFVKRKVEGTPLSNTAPQPKSSGISGSFKTNSAHQTVTVPQPQQRKLQQSSPKIGLQSSNIATDIKSESNGKECQDQASKPPANNEKISSLPSDKRKAVNDKSSAGTGGLLVNMWGRASAKSKPNSPPAETNNLILNPSEAQVCSDKAIEGGTSDDDGQDVSFKRASNGGGSRKRRVVFDFSDEEDINEDVVNLASPDPPKGKSCLDSKHGTEILAPQKVNLDVDMRKEVKQKMKEEKMTNNNSKQSVRGDSLNLKGENTEVSSSEKIQSPVPQNAVDKRDTMTGASSPKRRKVLKTWIDERGREVTEVVWEGEETETKKAETNTTKNAETNATKNAETDMTKKADNNVVTSAVNRAPVAKKSPAVGSTNPVGKAGNKKAGTVKDPKQGNILSFFKRV